MCSMWTVHTRTFIAGSFSIFCQCFTYRNKSDCWMQKFLITLLKCRKLTRHLNTSQGPDSDLRVLCYCLISCPVTACVSAQWTKECSYTFKMKKHKGPFTPCICHQSANVTFCTNKTENASVMRFSQSEIRWVNRREPGVRTLRGYGHEIRICKPPTWKTFSICCAVIKCFSSRC